MTSKTSLTQIVNEIKDEKISPLGKEILNQSKNKNLNKKQLRKEMGISLKEINGLLKSKQEITKPMASKLEKVLGNSTHFWIKKSKEG